MGLGFEPLKVHFKKRSFVTLVHGVPFFSFFVEKMAKYIRYLSINDIELAGIDMQNSVEQSKEAQCYTLSDVCGKREFQIKVRKSDEKLRPWRDFVSQNFYLS